MKTIPSKINADFPYKGKIEKEVSWQIFLMEVMQKARGAEIVEYIKLIQESRNRTIKFDTECKADIFYDQIYDSNGFLPGRV